MSDNIKRYREELAQLNAEWNRAIEEHWPDNELAFLATRITQTERIIKALEAIWK